MSPRGGVSSRWPHPGWVVSAVLALCCVYLLSNPFNSRGGNYKLQPCPRNCERKSLTSAQIQPTRYVNDTIASLYIEDFHKLPFQGGHARNDYAGWASAALSRIQRDAGIHGGIGEIGVHTGFYFMSLAVTARVGEPFFVLDLFESGQHKNIDQSGNGNKGIFLHNIRTLGVPEDKVVIHEGSSTEMPVQQLCTEFGTGFRFLSIDGGHAKDIVLNDLAFAECCLVDGGIASMDDYSNVFWPGVHEGIAAYFDRYGNQSRLAPFFMHGNKLYITTKTHHKQYLDAVTSMKFWDAACESDVYVHEGKRICIEAPGVNTGNEFKFKLGGHAIAVAEFRTFNAEKAKALWKESVQNC